ncbi:MAG: hypothetical protein U0136_20400 [Bdellovibrionota bacterium]
MKFLVFTTDVIPLPGLPTSGTALRTFGLIQGLRARGNEVHISVPKSALQGMLKSFDVASLDPQVQKQVNDLQSLAFDSSNQSRVLAEVRPDVILCGHWPAYTFQTKPSQPVIIDLAGPHLLERHYQGTPNHRGATLGKLSAVASADYFIVSGPSQRLYFLSFLLRAQVPQPEKRIFTITMPLDPNVPERDLTAVPNGFPRFVFGGVFLPWQNPAQSLERTAHALEKFGRGSLKLIGGSHPNYKIKEGVYAKLFDTLGKNPAVQTMPMLPYESFLRELSTSDVAIDLMQWNLERELAMTIRSTSYLWAGVPIVYNDFADLGKLIRKYDAGWTVSPKDQGALDAVFQEIYDDPQSVLRKSGNASRLAREVFSWDRAVQPLLEGIGVQDRIGSRELDIIVDFPDNANLTVTAERPVEQFFFSRVDGLSRIECRIATHNRNLAKPLRFSLYEVEGTHNPLGPIPRNAPKKLLVRREADASQIKNNDWYVLDTDPIAHSAGRTFALTIESENTSPEVSFAPWAVRGQPFPLLGLFHGKAAVEQTSLCLRTTALNQSTVSVG